MSRCKAKDCRKETPLAEWANHVGLHERHHESTKEHAARCLAFMSATVGRKLEASGMVEQLAEAAGVDHLTMQAAIDERRAHDETDPES